MAMLKMQEVRKMTLEEAEKKLVELRAELVKERAHASTGARLEHPMNIRVLRKGIARMLTHAKQSPQPGDGKATRGAKA
ncbi:MAG TPA: 50S ribosomal protein L29 [archaeon]|nr:50S ribosomal protein L29 [archaeon]HLD81012.1 50S ribosomal protein L29 [archaeon]